MLLQNKGGLLPLGRATDQRGQSTEGESLESNGRPVKVVKVVAMIGQIGASTAVLMGGKSDYCPENPISLLAGIQAKANASSGAWSVQYNDGSDTTAAVALAKSADVVIVVRGGVQDGEANDRKVITLDNSKDQMDACVAGLKAAAIPSSKMILAIVTGEAVALEEYVAIHVERRDDEPPFPLAHDGVAGISDEFLCLFI